MTTIWQDLRYSARLLRKHPGFTVTAVGVLTLGIGVNAGVFGIINGLMIRPLAGADAPGEVVGVFSKDRTAARDYRPFSYPGFSDVRDAGGPFAHLAGHTVALAGVTENNTTRQATVDIVSTGFFETLGVQPVYGRDFTMDEERPAIRSGHRRMPVAAARRCAAQGGRGSNRGGPDRQGGVPSPRRMPAVSR